MTSPTDASAGLAAPSAAAPAVSLRGLGAALATVVSWASAFVAMRVAVRSYPPKEVAVLRFLSAGLALGLFAIGTRMRLPARRDLWRFAALGLVGHALYNLALALGQAKVPAATAGFLIASAPIFMLLIAALLGQERPTALGGAGMLLSFAGVGLIAAGRGARLSFDPAALILLAAAALQAAYSMGQRPLLARYSAMQVSTFAAVSALAWLSPFAPGALARAAHVPLRHTAAALFLGLVPTAIGYSTWSVTLRYLRPTAAGSFLYLVPAVVVGLAWALLGEVPGVAALAGGGLVVAGVVVVQRLGRAPAPR